MSHDTSFCVSSLGTGENTALASSSLPSNVSSQCLLPSSSSAPHMARHSLPPTLATQVKPPRPKSSLTPTSTIKLSGAGSGNRADSPYSTSGSHTGVGQTGYDVYRTSSSPTPAPATSVLQPRTVSRRHVEHPAVSSTTSGYPHMTTALPNGSTLKDTSPNPSCKVHISGGTRPDVPRLSGSGAKRIGESSPGPRCAVVPGSVQTTNSGRRLTPVRSSSARQVLVTTRASTGTRGWTPPPRVSASVVHVGAVHPSPTQPSSSVGVHQAGRLPASATVPPVPRLARSLSPEATPNTETRSPGKETRSPGQASRQVVVPRLRSPKSWDKRGANNNVPSTTRTDDEDWADDDFISHRRSSPENINLDIGRSEQAPSEPERSPEERFPEALPEVINCRSPNQDDMSGRHGRMQDLERTIDDRIYLWEKQQQVAGTSEAAELRSEMARLKETSIEEITKLRTEVQRLQARKATPPPDVDRSQQRAVKSVFPRSTKSPASSRTLAADIIPPPNSPSGNENCEVTRLQRELQLREESAVAARQQIEQLQQEVEELRLLKKSAYAKDKMTGN